MTTIKDYGISKKKYITVKSLDPKSINAAIMEVEKRKKGYQNKLNRLAYELAKRGEEIAKERCRTSTNGDTGWLEESIWCEVDIVNNKFKVAVHMDADYAVMVEFGTGIVGAWNPHPNAGRRGWKHDVNDHGYEGWVYKDDAGDFYWTQGQPSNPIMWDTVQQLKEEFPVIARKVFKNV